MSPATRAPFYEYMDAANVDLKAFTEEFYYRITYSHLQPVLDTLEWLARETEVWFEITNLVIPQANDSLDEIRQMCDWILDHVGDGVPVHFTAFHPDFRMTDRPNTAPDLTQSFRCDFTDSGNCSCATIRVSFGQVPFEVDCGFEMNHRENLIHCLLGTFNTGNVFCIGCRMR